MGELDTGPRPATLPPEDDILGLPVQCMVLEMNKSNTIPCSMLEKVLMTLVEVYLGLVPDLLPPTIQVIMVDHLVFIVMLITEVGMGLTP